MWEESKMWFDLLTEDVDGMFMIVLKTIWYITFEASKCPGFWNFYLVGRPWLKRRHQRRSTRTCVKGRHRKHGSPAEPAKGGWRWGEGNGDSTRSCVRITKEQALLKEKLLLMEAGHSCGHPWQMFFFWRPDNGQGSFTEKVCGIPKKGRQCLAMIMWHLTNGWIMSFQGLWWPTMRLKPPPSFMCRLLFRNVWCAKELNLRRFSAQ